MAFRLLAHIFGLNRIQEFDMSGTYAIGIRYNTRFPSSANVVITPIDFGTHSFSVNKMHVQIFSSKSTTRVYSHYLIGWHVHVALNNGNNHSVWYIIELLSILLTGYFLESSSYAKNILHRSPFCFISIFPEFESIYPVSSNDSIY